MSASLPASAGACPPPARHSPLLVLLFFLILLLGGYLRFTAVLQTDMQHPLRADALDYFSYAYNLRQLGVYSRSPQPAISGASTAPAPDALRHPGYPLMLAFFVDKQPTKAMLTAILLFQAVLGTLLMILAHGIYRRLMPETWALTASLLTALSPHLVVINVYVLSESLFTFLGVLAVTLMVWHVERPLWWRALLCGLVLGLAALTRPTMQYFLIPYLLLLAVHLPKTQRARQVLTVVAGFLIAMSPWWLRNLFTLGAASDPTLMLSTLIHGSYPDFMYNGLRHTTGVPYRFDPELANFGGNLTTVMQELSNRFSEAPGTYLRWYLISKPLVLFSWVSEATYLAHPGSIADKIFIYPVTQSPYFQNIVFIITRTLMYYTHWVWISLAIAATVLVWTKTVSGRLDTGTRFTVRLLSVLIIYFIVLHMAGFPLGRYSIPIRPFLYGLAILFLYHGWDLANPWLGKRLRTRQIDSGYPT